jgi:hypothetical protein
MPQKREKKKKQSETAWIYGREETSAARCLPGERIELLNTTERIINSNAFRLYKEYAKSSIQHDIYNTGVSLTFRDFRLYSHLTKWKFCLDEKTIEWLIFYRYYCISKVARIIPDTVATRTPKRLTRYPWKQTHQLTKLTI